MTTNETHTRHYFFSDRELDQDAGRKWPASFTFAQMKDQLQYEIENNLPSVKKIGH